MRFFTSILNYKTGAKNNGVKMYISYAVAATLFLVYPAHIYFPTLVVYSTVVLVALLGIGLSSWAGGYKAGTAYTLLFVVVVNIPLAQVSESLTRNQSEQILRSFLLVVEGILLSFLVDAARRQEKILLYKRRERDMKQKALELERENVSYRKEIRYRDEFLSIASHELKTPLTSMLLQTQTALHNIKNVSLAQFSIESLLRMLESVEHQTKRLSKMINELFNVSIMTTGNLVLEKEATDLNELVQDVLNDFEDRLRHEGYTITFELEENSTGNWDKLRIAQAIANLLSNAIKYGNKKPIIIRAKRKADFAEFIITDHGIGISKKKQRDIFGLFERVNPAGDIKGLGVGLYISKQIVEAHGGTLLVSSRPNKGTSFVLRLPLDTQQNLLSTNTQILG